MSSAITDSYTDDHHRCDRLLAEAETHACTPDWPTTTAAVAALAMALNRHFDLEEGVLFPALVSVFQIAENPIEIMVAEHGQMRALLTDLGTAAGARDQAACLGLIETLHFLIQQHNYKEEGVIYPMADGALPERADALAARMADSTGGTAPERPDRLAALPH